MPGGIDSFDATVSGTASNSYLTLEEADALTAEYDCSDDWSSLGSQAAKERLLIKATRKIDRYRKDKGGWGPPAVAGQKLAFPRECDPVDEIPEGVKRAVMEAVNGELSTAVDEIKRLQAEGVTSSSLLGQSLSMSADESLLPAEARAELDLLASQDAPIQTIRPKLGGSETESFFFET